MKNPFKNFLRCTMIVGTGAAAVAFAHGEPMKLVNTKTGYVVVEFQDGRAHFHDRFLEAEMQETGILIPPSQMHEFNEEEVVFLGDELFEKAFLEVYYPLCIANSLYQWKN